MNKDSLHVRTVLESEFLGVYSFVSNCESLENYAEHFYKIMLRYFGDSCFVAEQNGEIVGFCLGFFSQKKKEDYFLWQIGIRPDLQGKGLGTMFLQEMEKRLKGLGCRRIELTIDPRNAPSQRLFEKLGYRNISRKEGSVVEVEGNTAVEDYYSPGRHFMLYEKKMDKK